MTNIVAIIFLNRNIRHSIHYTPIRMSLILGYTGLFFHYIYQGEKYFI